MLKFIRLIKHFDDRQKEQDKQANELFKRGLFLQKRSDELDMREKRIADREEISSVRLFEPGQSTPTRVVAKHPALAMGYGKDTVPAKDYEELLIAYGALNRACNAAPQDNLAALRAANIARNPEWFPDGAPPVLPASFRGLELAGEVGEGVEAAMTHLAMLTASTGRICNILKKLERERLGLNGSRSTKEALAEEIGDFIICADLVGMDFDIALWPAVVAKFNATSAKLNMKTMLPTPEGSPPYGTKPEWQAPEAEEDGRTCDMCGGDGGSRQPGTDGICPECNGEGKVL